MHQSRRGLQMHLPLAPARRQKSLRQKSLQARQQPVHQNHPGQLQIPLRGSLPAHRVQHKRASWPHTGKSEGAWGGLRHRGDL